MDTLIKANPTSITVLPAHLRPAYTVRIPYSVGLANTLVGYFHITPNGEVTCVPKDPGIIYLSKWRLDTYRIPR